MALQSNPYILWQLIPGLVLLWIGLYIQSRPIKKRESRIFSIMMFAGALWALASAIQLITPNNDWQRTWNSITYIGILIVPTAWFLLAVKITGLSLDHVQRIEKWLWTVPILTFLFVLTNDFHKLFFTDQTVETIAGFTLLENTFGPLFYFHTVFSYILIFAGTIILSFSAIRNFRQYGTRAYGILVGVITPLVMNATYLFGDIPQGFPDPTPVAFSVSGIAFAWAIIGGRMLEIVPLAHDVIVQNLSTGVLVLDSEQGILNINPTAVEILGLAEQRDQQGTLSELVNRIPTFEPLSAAIGGQYDLNEPLEIIIPETGKTFDVTVTSVGDNDKKLTGWLVQFNDISQRVVAEANLVNTQETFETILDTLHDSYFEADPNGVITYVNQSLVNALGYPSRATVVGKHFRNFIHRKSIQGIYESFQKLYEDKLPQESVEYYFIKKDGEERIAEIAVSPVFDGTEIIGSRGIIRDITERHRQAARMATLYQVGLATTSTLDMDAVLVTIYEQCRQVMSADVFYVALIDEKNEEIAYPLFFDNGHRLNPFRLSRDTGFAGWIIQNQVPYLINNLEVEKDQLPVKMYHTGGQQIRSYIGVPLMQRDGAIGVLSAQSYQADVYKDEDVQLLSTLAAHAATAIKNAQLYEAEQKARERLESQNREILEQRDLLNSLLHYAPLAIVNLNLDSKISAVNPAFEKLFGYAQNEVVGLDIDDILSTPEIVEEMRALTEKGLQERTYSIASRKKKDGNLVNVEIFSEPFYIAGEKCGILIFYNGS
jgi:PAS domain S-box-containing protein